MNKKFLSVMLLATFFIGSVSLLTACSDDDTVYDDTSVTSQISSLTSQLSTLQSELSSLQTTAENAASAAASATTAANAASSLAESAAATAKAEAIEEAIAQTKELIAASEAATDEEIAALSALIEGIDSDLNELSSSLNTVSDDVAANAEAIAALQVQVTAVEEYKTSIEALETNVGAIQDDVTELTSSVETLDATIEDLQAELATLTSTVDGKCTMDEVKEYVASVISGETASVYTAEEVDEKIAEIADQIIAINASLLTLTTDKLTSLVFIPDLYINGVEGTRYPYAAGTAGYAVTTGYEGESNYEGQAYVIPEGATYEYTTWVPRVTLPTYSLTPSAKANYHYNPTSAVLEGVEWDFDVLNVEAITRSIPTWDASVDSVDYSKGILGVYYKIASPENLTDPATEDAWGDAIEGAEYPVMSLKATLANDTTVNSDYAAVVPAKRSFNYIEFTTESKYTATIVDGNDERDLYLAAYYSAENKAPISWAYNGGELDLASVLCVSYAQSSAYADGWSGTMYDCEGTMTLEELKAWGLSLEFEAVKYEVGENSTDQSAYCVVTKDGKFTPAYVASDGSSVAITSSNGGESAIGRTPIVLVKVVDASGNVVIWGYVKISIDEVQQEVKTQDVGVVVAEETFAYSCDEGTLSVTWDNISANLYEALHMSATTFRNTYTAQEGTYIYNAATDTYSASTLYGTVVETGDTEGSTTTTVLTATVTAAQKTEIVDNGGSQTIYLKYTNTTNSNDNVYVGFTITIADLPTVTFTQRIGSQWVDDQDGALVDGNETKWNVPAPTTGGDVTAYEKTLNDLFYNQKVVATLGGANASLYKASEVSYAYKFASKQDAIGSYTLTVSSDYLTLYANGSELATITDAATGAIEYADNDVAKAILNLYSHDSETLAYAKVVLYATYGDCDLALDERTFIVDFIRPIDIEAGEDAVFEDATADGSSVSLANLITITDWRDMPVYSKTYSTGYVDNGVNLYDYYQFKSITVDLENAKYNGTSYTASQASISLSLVDANGTEVASPATITTASDLSNIYIKQFNNNTVANEYTLQIPVEVTYAWGTVSYEVNATVKRTIANAKN